VDPLQKEPDDLTIILDWSAGLRCP
jgi:hypothetical protein